MTDAASADESTLCLVYVAHGVLDEIEKEDVEGRRTELGIY